MAEHPDGRSGITSADWEPKRGQLLLSGLVLAALCALVLVSLGSIFAVGPWTSQALSITTPTILIATLTRALRPRLRASAALIGSAVGAGVWLLWFVASGHPAAWAQDPSGVLQQIRIQLIVGSAPLDPVGPLTDVLLLMALLVAVLAALILVGLGKPLGAGALIALLVLVPTFVTGLGVGWATLLGVGLLLALLAWLGSPAPSPPGLLAAGTAVAVAAGVVALAPDTRDRVWNDAVLPGPVSGAVPDVTIALADDLRQRSGTRVFTFTASDPGPYRFTLATLSDFTDGRWLPQDRPDPDGLTVAEPRSPTSVPPDPAGPQPAAPSSVSVTIEGLLSEWLPLPQSVTGVGAGAEAAGFDATRWRWTADAATARADRDITRRGYQYTAEAEQLLADRATSRSVSSAPQSATRLFADPSTAPGRLSPYLALPSGLPDEIAETAEEVAGTSGNRFAVGLALQEWFRSDAFTYDESAPYRPGTDPEDPYAVMTALLEERAGFCVHYASTFAVMARELGAPTRVAVGYASRGSDAETVVRGRELHAWPEIYIDDIGWVAFEPTPGGAGLRADTDQRVPVTPDRDGSAEERAPSPSPAPEPEPEETPGAEEPAGRQGRAEGFAEERAAAMRSALLWTGGSLLATLLLAPVTLRRLRTGLRLRRISAGSAPAQQAWDEVRDTVVDLGLLERADPGRAPRARTAEALVEHLEAGGSLSGEAAHAARALAMRLAAERYRASGPVSGTASGAEAGAARGAAARAELRIVTRALVDGAPRAAVLMAVLFPRSVLERHLVTRPRSAPAAAGRRPR